MIITIFANSVGNKYKRISICHAKHYHKPTHKWKFGLKPLFKEKKKGKLPEPVGLYLKAESFPGPTHWVACHDIVVSQHQAATALQGHIYTCDEERFNDKLYSQLSEHDFYVSQIDL